MNMKDRIIWARKSAGFESQEALADAVRKLPGAEKFTQQSVSKLESGKDKSTGFIVHIAKVTGVSPDWLAMEIGPRTQAEINNQTGLLDISELSQQSQASIKEIMGTLKKQDHKNVI